LSISSLCTSQAPPNSIPIHLSMLQVHECESLTCAQFSCK
jgi:hypothetical protein